MHDVPVPVPSDLLSAVFSLGGCALSGTSPSDTCILVVVAHPSGDAYETSQTER
jgi:hypothetical protein